MRIALVHPFLWTEVRRGGERYVSDLATHLHAGGHEVDVLVSGTGARSELLDGITVRRARRIAHPWLHRRGVTAVETHGLGALPALLRRRYDLVHAFTPSAALAGVASRTPTVFTELGHPVPGRADALPPWPRWWRAAMRRADAITALSASAADAVATLSGRRPMVLSPGVRTDVFRPTSDPRADPPEVLFCSDADQPQKGAALLLAAFARLLDDRPETVLVFAGPGHPERLLDAAGPVATRVRSNVVILGTAESEELLTRYRAASVSVLPSVHEAFGLVLVESLACGTPVVCTDTAGMVEIVDDERIGRRFPRGDEAGLARALVGAIDLASRPATAVVCTEQASRWAWDTVVGPAHDALYEDVARPAATARRSRARRA